MKKSILMLVLSVFMVSSAQAMEIGVLGGGNMTRTSGLNSAIGTYNNVMDYSFGASFYASSLIPIPGFGLELDALLMNRKTEMATVALTTNTAKQRYVMVPAIVRFSALPIVSIGAGPYVAPAMGKLKVNDVEQTEESSMDYGLVGSLKFQLPLAPLVSIVADGRYIYGMKEISEGSDTKFRDIQVLAGISFGF